MRIVPVLATTLILTTSAALAQQATAPKSAKTTSPSQAVTASGDQPPAHPITPAQFHELLELTGANKVKAQMTGLMWVTVQKMFPPYTPKNVLVEIESGFENLDLGPMELKVYQRYISTEDAAQIIAFDKTPAGQRMIRVSPQLTREIYMSGEKIGEELCARVFSKHADEIKAAAAKYQADHPDTPKITAPQ